METSPYTRLPAAERMRLLRNAIQSASRDLSGANSQMLQSLVDQIEQLSTQLVSARCIATVREQPFASDVPGFGRLIVLIRRGWNWMSTKWWVRPLVRQQNDFNAEVLDLLLSTLQVARTATHALNQLSTQNAIQHAELLHLQAEVKSLQLQLEGHVASSSAEAGPSA